jgi:hypothetical protein
MCRSLSRRDEGETHFCIYLEHAAGWTNEGETHFCIYLERAAGWTNEGETHFCIYLERAAGWTNPVCMCARTSVACSFPPHNRPTPPWRLRPNAISPSKSNCCCLKSVCYLLRGQSNPRMKWENRVSYWQGPRDIRSPPVPVCLFPWASAASHGCTAACWLTCTARFGRSNFGHQMPRAHRRVPHSSGGSWNLCAGIRTDNFA